MNLVKAKTATIKCCLVRTFLAFLISDGWLVHGNHGLRHCFNDSTAFTSKGLVWRVEVLPPHTQCHMHNMFSGEHTCLHTKAPTCHYAPALLGELSELAANMSVHHIEFCQNRRHEQIYCRAKFGAFKISLFVPGSKSEVQTPSVDQQYIQRCLSIQQCFSLSVNLTRIFTSRHFFPIQPCNGWGYIVTPIYSSFVLPLGTSDLKGIILLSTDDLDS